MTSPEENPEVRPIDESEIETRIDPLTSGALTAGATSTDLPSSSDSHRPTTDPTLIGPYHLERKLGHGGMGQVWLAEQTAPVRRHVALKLIRGGLNDAEIVHRFESERQTLAVMDHPCIAKVFDADSTEEGQPYFVMEYVDGAPITSYCDQHKLSTRQRLQLFIQVCEGVQHAHQKSVIHRDLKPSNILVSDINGAPVPRIIDFGIAKAISTDLTGNQTALTQVGALIGTPNYMSPEQSDPDISDIDTRTDVYSLGAVLYELLTGSLPFDQGPGKKQRLDELFRQLREVDPIMPSARLSSAWLSKDRLSWTETASARGTTPPQLANQLKGDLDWIVLKALEKDRTRRYATPSELAADIRRFLADEPIVARPPSTLYQFSKFAKRNRILVAGIAAVIFVLAAGATTSTLLAIRATHAQKLAETREAEAIAARNAEAQQRKLAIQNAVQARKETVAAQHNFNMARDAVNNYFTTVSESPELKAHNLEKLRRRLLLTARDFYQKFVRDHAHDTYLHADLGGAMLRLGSADTQVGDNPQAEQSLLEARHILQTSYQKHPNNPFIAINLFNDDENLGVLYTNTNQFKRSEQAYRHAALFIEAWRRNHRLSSDDLDDVSLMYNSYGTLLVRDGNVPGALAAYRQALHIDHQLSKRSPQNNDYKNAVLLTDVNMVATLAAAGQVARAVPFALDSVHVGESLLAHHPNDPDVISHLASGYENLGGIYTLLGQNSKALKAHYRSMQLYTRLSAEHPAIPAYSIELSGTYINLGELEQRQGNSPKAIQWLKKAGSVLRGVLSANPHQSKARYFLSYDYSWQARAYENEHHQALANQAWKQFLRYDDHDDPTLRAGKAMALASLDRIPRATALAAKVLASRPDPDTLFDLAAVYALANASLTSANPQRASQYAAKSLLLLQQAAKEGYFNNPQNQDRLRNRPQFNSLRSRRDFRSMLAGIETDSQH